MVTHQAGGSSRWLRGWSTTSATEGLRALLREEGVSFQVIKTFKASNDPDFEAKKNRVLSFIDLVDGIAQSASGDPHVVMCVDEFGPLNLQPHPGSSGHPSLPAKAIPLHRDDVDYVRPMSGRTVSAI